MSNISQNAIAYLQKRFPKATVFSTDPTSHQITKHIAMPIWFMTAHDPELGIKQRVVALNKLVINDDIIYIINNLDKIFNAMDGVKVSFDNTLQPTGHAISSTQMPFASKIILYINELNVPYDSIISVFTSAKILVDIINENEMYHSLFISYGGPDEAICNRINTYLKSHGIKTWFFPDDALPGDKLHRMMFEGVNIHDRILFICSEQSLKRPGVLNELERILEREANEGGSNILIPVTLDDYVYKNWAPERRDLAAQVRNRVILKIDVNNFESASTQKQLKKLAKVLSKEHTANMKRQKELLKIKS